jgi:hypothetical protein
LKLLVSFEWQNKGKSSNSSLSYTSGNISVSITSLILFASGYSFLSWMTLGLGFLKKFAYKWLFNGKDVNSDNVYKTEKPIATRFSRIIEIAYLAQTLSFVTLQPNIFMKVKIEPRYHKILFQRIRRQDFDFQGEYQKSENHFFDIHYDLWVAVERIFFNPGAKQPDYRCFVLSG